MPSWSFEHILKQAGFIPFLNTRHPRPHLIHVPIVLDSTTSQDADAKLVTLGSLLSQKPFTLLYVWSHTCENCLATLADSLEAPDQTSLQFFPIHGEDAPGRQGLLHSLKLAGYEGPFGVDVDGILVERLAVTAFPAVFLFSQRGSLIAYSKGYIDLNSNGMDILKSYLKFTSKNPGEENQQMESYDLMSFKNYLYYLNEYSSFTIVLTLIFFLFIGVKKRLFWL